ncbi:fibronectin type III domain-containing protein [Blastococcus sp. CT_GayMR16]|uniref:fibronectin type III domain-containing protein n=1 Tax=Blastococcus sp. CT_GayMR16 TaxID=2559607 RepID=UPI0010734FB8|nr:fibronectin type III domain-containing protein [Blastococcus sp. CT_GayMR16]TFV89968.1 hypothetical protein E4P38_05855 [Blastococcus sp. CT_GayMR16]
MTLLDGADPWRRRSRARTVVSGALALLVLVLAAGTTCGPAALPAPPLRLASTTSPAPPTNVNPAPIDRALNISWTAPAETFISGYRVFLDGTLVASPTGTSATVTGLVNGRGYVVTVTTVTFFLGTTYVGTTPSSAVTGTPKDSVVPASPTGVAAVRGDGRVTLSWVTNSADYDADGYRVVRDGLPLTGLLNGSGTSGYLDTTVTNDVAYGYAVQTHDTSGNWSSSSTPLVSATPTDLTAPATPTGLLATRGDGQVSLTWAANPEVDLATYRLLRDGVEFATVVGTSYVDPGRTNDVTYAYSIAAVDGHGNRSPTSSPAVSATPTDLTAPATPTGFVGGRGDGRAGLAWDPNAEPDLAGYAVLRDGVQIATVTATTYMDLGRTNDTTYSYTLVAVDSHGNRSAPTAAVLVTPTDLTPPDPPTGLVASRGDGQVTLSWNPNVEPDLASYRVVRNLVEIATVTGGTGHVDVGLANDTAYTYTVVAVDTHGNRSVSSSPDTATPTDLGAPATPTGVVATPGDGQVGLSWTANVETDLSTYRVLRNGVEIVGLSGTSYLDTGLTNDTTYSYTLAAVDTHGNRSAASLPVTATPTDLTAPAAPTGLSAGSGDQQVSLSWTANAEPDLATYRVLRDGVEIVAVTGTSYLDTGRTNGTSSTYRLVAVDSHGNRSPASGPATATPADGTAPAAPTGVVATRGEGQVSLSWTANAEPDLASYRVLRDGVEIATVPGTSYLDAGRTNDTSYSYAIVAVDNAGNRSAASSPASATPTDLTPPAAPTGLVGIRGSGRIDLTWTANSEPDLATYRVLRDGVEIATVTGTTYSDNGRPDGTTFTYAIVAVDTHGNRSSASVASTVTPADVTPPAVPSGLAAAPGEGQVSLAWNANGEPDLASYRVLRDGVEIVTVTGTTYLDTGRTNGITYTYTLAAVDTSGNRSAESAPVPGTPVDAAPAPPTGVTASPGDRRAVVSWTAPADADVVSYRVLADDGSTVLATAAAPTTQAAVSGLTNGTSYRFMVAAVDAGGRVSAPSALTAAITPVSPAVPALGAGEAGGLTISSDGRYVVVGTRARLVPADTNTAYELYVLDRTAGTATRIAPLSAGATGAADSTNTAAPVISADGSSIVLTTTASLVAGDTNGLPDVYRRDTATGTWSLVSVPAGGAVNGSTAGAVLHTGSSVYATSPPVVMSADGDLVLFYSARTDLVAGDTNGVVDLFAKRISTGVVTRVSTTTAGGNLGGAATGPALALTPDGRFALFPAASASGAALLYRKTLSGAGAGDLVVVSSVTVAGNATQFAVFRDLGDVDISDDGRYVALVTAARITTATPTANGSTGLAYRMDLATGGVLALGDGQQTVWEHQVELDPTGRYAFFATSAAELAGDTNGHTDHYRRDLAGGTVGPLVLVTADADGRATAGPIGSITSAEYGRLIALSGDRVVVTTSQALVSADTNRLRDLYVKDLVSGIVSSPLG